MAKKDMFTREWIITNSVEVLENYDDESNEYEY